MEHREGDGAERERERGVEGRILEDIGRGGSVRRMNRESEREREREKVLEYKSGGGV